MSTAEIILKGGTQTNFQISDARLGTKSKQMFIYITDFEITVNGILMVLISILTTIHFH